MAEQTYTLTDPNGTVVQVTGAARRDALLARGYTEGTPKPKSTKKKA